MRNQIFGCKSVVYVLFFTFPMLVIGCGEDSNSEVYTERVAYKQLMGKKSINANEPEVIRVDASDTKAPQVLPVEGDTNRWMDTISKGYQVHSWRNGEREQTSFGNE